MAIFWATATVLVAVLYALRTWKRSEKKKKLPPGPKGFPLFGSLNMLGKLPHRDLQKLARKYGPIMHMRLGVTPTIIVSSPEAAELFLKTHDLVFASRPPSEAARHMSWGQKNLVFSPYSPYWRDMRKMCTLELFSTAKISSFKPMRTEEVNLFVGSIREVALDRVTVDLSAKITALSADMTCRMVYGKKYSNAEFDERGFKVVIEEALHLAAIPNLGDYMPFLARFDLQGFTKRMKELSKVFDGFFEKIIDEHARSEDKEGRTKDFVDIMLSFMESKESEYPIERPHIKALMLDMLAASMDTTATAIEWTVTELIKNPATLHKLQEELESVVGMKRMVEESDLEKLEYLDMVVKESMRLHPVAPLLIPHAATEDCMVDGYDIPGKSRILVNVWAIGRDPATWCDPEEFVPERFEGSSVDVKGRDFKLIPFGSGRRGCPGLQLGLTVVRLVVAQLAHCFDWELPDGVSASELDMDEVFGLTIPRKNHLLAVPTYRLRV